MTLEGKNRFPGHNRCLGIVLLIIAILAGCSGIGPGSDEPLVLSTKSGRVELTFPSDWSLNTEPNPFDLQALSRFERANTGVFEWSQVDLADDFTPRELFESQIADMRSKRDNFELFQEESETRVNGKTLTTAVYAGDLSSSRYLYAFTLITFDSDPDLVLVVLQVTLPSEWDRFGPILHSINASARAS